MATILQFPTRARVYCDPHLPSGYRPQRTVERDERERVFGRDHAAAYTRRRENNHDDGPQAA